MIGLIIIYLTSHCIILYLYYKKYINEISIFIPFLIVYFHLKNYQYIFICKCCRALHYKY